VFTVQVSDGWNISERVVSKRFGISGWNSFRSFMGWKMPSDAGEVLKKTVPTNLSVFTALYYVLLVLAFLFHPEYLVRWHGWIYKFQLPLKDKTVKVLAPFFLANRCLDITVKNLRNRALELFSAYPDVKARPKWVPAPLRIQDELILGASGVDQRAAPLAYT
jgi:hypothetical protein